jgi:hypothetical protein
VPGAGGAEGCQGDLPGGHRVRGDRQRVPGVVVDPRDDLDFCAAGQAVVDEVGLPPLLGLLGGEPDVRRLRPFLRLRGDQALAGQVPADRRRRYPDLVVPGQVPADRVRPGIQALFAEFLAQPDDQVGHIRADRPWRLLRPPGPRLERGLALGLIAGQQRVDPGPGDPVRPGNLRDRALLSSDSGDDEPGFGHPRSVFAARQPGR